MKKPILILFLMICITSCKKNTEGIINHQESTWVIKIQGQNHEVKWKKFEDDSIKIRIPVEWNFVESPNSWKSFKFDNANPELFFGIAKYDVTKIKLNAEQYLVEGLKYTSKNFGDLNYVIKKLHFANGKYCYLITLFTQYSGIKYVTYEMLYQSQNTIFDFALRSLDNETTNELNYNKFLLVIHSFEYNYDKILDRRMFNIKKVERLKLESLERK